MKSGEHHTIAYSYNVGDTIERFTTCTPEEQGNIEAHIAQVIIDSFVKPADDDYVAARALAIGGLHRSFFWSAAQTVEKYLKAFLLLHGVSVKDASHKLSGLLTKAKKVDPTFGKLWNRGEPELLSRGIRDAAGASRRRRGRGGEARAHGGRRRGCPEPRRVAGF